MRNWELSFTLHWPLDRFALGWEMLRPDEEHEEAYWTFTLFLFVLTLELDIDA